MTKFARLLGISVIGIAAVTGSARADLYEYKYQGNPFNAFVDGTAPQGFSAANAVTFDLKTSGAIAANTTYYLENSSSHPSPGLVDWTASDGSNTYTAAQAGQANTPGFSTYSWVTTDAGGAIASWLVAFGTLGIPGFPPEVTISSCGPAPCIQSIGVGGSYAGDYDQINPVGGSYLYVGIATTPGAWTVTDLTAQANVPEPSGWMALVGGLLGLTLVKDARRRSQPRR